MTQADPPHASIVSRTVDWTVEPDALLVSLANTTAPAILESTQQSTGYGRYSIFACNPITEFRGPHATTASPFAQLAEASRSLPAVDPDHSPGHFAGGWIGYVSYEAGARVEPAVGYHPLDPRIPMARFFLYDTAAVFDHLQRKWQLVAVDWPDGFLVGRSSASRRVDELAALLRFATPQKTNNPPDARITAFGRSALPKSAYLQRIDRIKGYIAAGDAYQVNLSKRFYAETTADHWALYRRLRHISPSSHGAFLPWSNASIISCSPELFLDLNSRRVITRPIKGTRPASGDPVMDRRMERELADSEKDAAELNMIVDLLRNDLGRVCNCGSVNVEESSLIERHPTVMHRVATVTGILRPGCGWPELLEATFPSGSVTGAPKIRAMQIIRELEPTPRGVYCGMIGWIGLDGSMHMNVAIRTMVQVGRSVSLYAGGAIVADSDPEAEYEEMLAKAAAMMKAAGCHEPSRWESSEELVST